MRYVYVPYEYSLQAYSNTKRMLNIHVSLSLQTYDVKYSYLLYQSIDFYNVKHSYINLNLCNVKHSYQSKLT